MARAQSTDPLMVANFGLIELSSSPVAVQTGNGARVLDASVFPKTKGRTSSPGKIFLGFQGISVPEVGIEYQEFQEGNWPYTRKTPLTRATVGDVTISQAVVPASSDFYIWIHQALWGRGAPRRNFAIAHLDRGKAKFVRLIFLYNCLPVTWKPSEDLEANSSDVSIESLTFNVERIAIDVPLDISSSISKAFNLGF